jgi:hypothetical protein
VYWLVLAALGDALTAIVGCAGLLAGVWLIARSSRAGAGVPASGGEPAEIAPGPGPGPAAAPADESAPDDSPATTFRHGPIRLASAAGRDDAASPSEPRAPPVPWPAPAPPPEPGPALAPAPAPEPQPEPEPPFVPPPFPAAPRTPFRQGRIRLGGLERGGSSRGTADEPPDEPPDAAA